MSAILTDGLGSGVHAGQSEEHADLFVDSSVLNAPDAEQRLDAIWGFYDKVNMEDIVACERVQIGVASQPYRGGRMVFRFEETIHRWSNMYAFGMPQSPPAKYTHIFTSPTHKFVELIHPSNARMPTH